MHLDTQVAELRKKRGIGRQRQRPGQGNSPLYRTVESSESIASVAGVTRRTYPGHRHELHNEPDGAAVLDDVIAWLRERVARGE